MNFKEKEIELVFENCEYLTVKADISFDVVDDNSINNVLITITNENNGIHIRPWNSKEETTKFNRISEYDDVTQIVVDGITYYPAWYDEDEYCTSQYNEYQNTYRAEDGSMVINISTENKKRETEREKILSLLTEYWNNENCTFGQIVLEIGSHLYKEVENTSDDGIIKALEKMIA